MNLGSRYGCGAIADGRRWDVRSALSMGAWVVGLLSLSSVQAAAAPLAIYTFTGTVTHAACGRSGDPCASVSVSDPIQGILSYEGQPTDWNPLDSNTGIYRTGSDFSITYSILFGGTAAGSSVTQTLRIDEAPAHGGAADVFQITDYQSVAPALASVWSQAQLDLFFNFSPDAFSNDGIPLWLDGSKFTGGNVYLSDFSTFDVWASIDSISATPVPEPATGLIAAGGLALMLLRRRRGQERV